MLSQAGNMVIAKIHMQYCDYLNIQHLNYREHRVGFCALLLCMSCMIQSVLGMSYAWIQKKNPWVLRRFFSIFINVFHRGLYELLLRGILEGLRTSISKETLSHLRFFRGILIPCPLQDPRMCPLGYCIRI